MTRKNISPKYKFRNNFVKVEEWVTSWAKSLLCGWSWSTSGKLAIIYPIWPHSKACLQNIANSLGKLLLYFYNIIFPHLASFKGTLGLLFQFYLKELLWCYSYSGCTWRTKMDYFQFSVDIFRLKKIFFRFSVVLFSFSVQLYYSLHVLSIGNTME